MNDDALGSLLEEQARYYEERAPEYDDLYLRRGRHDLGHAFNTHWHGETARLEAAMQAFARRGGSFLELAPGTGLWTRFLVGPARRVLAVDASSAMLELNRERYGAGNVEYVQADLWTWEPARAERFDAIVMGFFISHVPPDRFAPFWDRIRPWLVPGGRVFLCDDLAGPGRPRSSDVVDDGPGFLMWRTLDDGRRFKIVKIFYTPETLTEKLAEVGWDADLATTGTEFLFGTATPRH